MSDYVIYTDSACDVSSENLNKWNVKCLDLTFHFEGEDKEYSDRDMPVSEFYQRMLDGEIAKTAAINVGRFEEAFEAVFEEGKDILYIGFSTGLSITATSGINAGEEVVKKYPKRKFFAVDTLCASTGEGYVLYLACQKRDEGASIEEVYDYVKQTAPKMSHIFTVDDLVYLKRGGRVSAATAAVGTLLNIKPVLHVDDEGHLIPMHNVKGRKKSIQAIAKHYFETVIDEDEGRYMICQANCMDDAKELERILYEKTGKEAILITDVGPVIGSHSGPGTLALFFLASKR